MNERSGEKTNENIKQNEYDWKRYSSSPNHKSVKQTNWYFLELCLSKSKVCFADYTINMYGILIGPLQHPQLFCCNENYQRPVIKNASISPKDKNTIKVIKKQTKKPKK